MIVCSHHFYWTFTCQIIYTAFLSSFMLVMDSAKIVHSSVCSIWLWLDHGKGKQEMKWCIETSKSECPQNVKRWGRQNCSCLHKVTDCTRIWCLTVIQYCKDVGGETTLLLYCLLGVHVKLSATIWSRALFCLSLRIRVDCTLSVTHNDCCFRCEMWKLSVASRVMCSIPLHRE